jgi:hypothetical protein
MNNFPPFLRAKRAIEANLGFIRKPCKEYKGLTIIFLKLDCAPFDPLRRIITTELKTEQPNEFRTIGIKRATPLIGFIMIITIVLKPDALPTFETLALQC